MFYTKALCYYSCALVLCIVPLYHVNILGTCNKTMIYFKKYECGSTYVHATGVYVKSYKMFLACRERSKLTNGEIDSRVAYL